MQIYRALIELSACVVADFYEVKSATFRLGLKVGQTFARCFVLLKDSSIPLDLEIRVAAYPFNGVFFVGH